MGTDELIQLTTTIDSDDKAQSLAIAILERHLAACIQIDGPIRSLYWWKECIENEQEWKLTIKTQRRHYSALETLIKNIHPYETPEIIASPIICGSSDYLDWLHRETNQSNPEQ